jgi:hypothetical protein
VIPEGIYIAFRSVDAKSVEDCTLRLLRKTFFLISTNIFEKNCIFRQFKMLQIFFLFLVFSPFAFIRRFSITAFLLYMTLKVKQKALVITSFNLRPYHPPTLLLPPCYHDYPYRPVPHTIFPYTIPQPRSFFPISFFFPACLTTLFCHLCQSHQNIYLSFILYFWFSTNPLILDLRKKGGEL